MNKQDTIGRQSRIYTQPTGKFVPLTDRRRIYLKAIHDHGPLNTRMLHRFTGGKPGNQNSTNEALKDMSRETNTEHGGPYLSRPFDQNRTFNPRRNFLVYGLAEAGHAALRERDLFSEFRPRGRNPWRHEHMCAHITASIELSCIERGYRYIPQHELLDRGVTLEQMVKYSWDGKQTERMLIPDALFAIDYGGTFRTFVLEADRATEAVEPNKDHQKSFKRNALQYQAFIGGGQYKRAYQMKGGLVVLHVTLSEARVQSFLRTLDANVPGCTYQMMQAVPDFADDFRSPEFLPQFADRPWQRPGAEPFDIMQA